METFAIHTLGCKVNSYESQSMCDDFTSHGYLEVGFHELADIYMIHTCAVTNTAAQKSRQKVRQAIKTNPNAMICVVGCYVQTNAAELLKLDGVDVLIGSSGKHQIVGVVEEAYQNKQRQRALAGSGSHSTGAVAPVGPWVRIDDLRQQATFESSMVRHFDHQVRAYVKVQDGCNQFCSYCIIPFTRGRERSIAPEDAVKNVKELVAQGHKEIVLAGIHTGRYGVDHQTSLLTLLQQMVSEVPKMQRLRLSSIEANEIHHDLIVFLAQHKQMGRHLHIPLQSGEDTTLRAMNRTYNTQEFFDKLCEIRSLNPGIAISSDVIVGFPDETREDFEQTVAFIKKCQLSFLHVFPYSKRERTVAANLGNQIEEKEKKERVQILMELSQQCKKEFHRQFVGKEVQVLIEQSKDGHHMGHASEYFKVLITKETRNLKGEMVDVIIDGYDEDACYGHLS